MTTTESIYKTVEEILAVVSKHADKQYGLYQLCPKCDGDKVVSRPPDTPADVRACSSWEKSYPCPLCKGEGKLVRPEITDKK